MPYTKEQILEAFKKLPEDVKEAMFSVDTVEIMQQIGEKHKLMIDKIGELADETGLVMLGLTHPNQFINNLTERLEVEHDIAKEIAEEISSKVFFPIRENLKKIHGIAPTLSDISVGEVGPPAGSPRFGEAGEAGVPTSDADGRSVGKITTPRVIMSMPIDLTKTGKIQPEAETSLPPDTFGIKTREEVFRSLEKKIEVPSIQETPTFKEVGAPTPPKTDVGVKKVDPYREPTL